MPICRLSGDTMQVIMLPNRAKSVWVIVATSQYGNKYLKTDNDGEQPNNLLILPECP